MVWSKTDGRDNTPRYIQGVGSTFTLTKSKKGALDEVPFDWEVFRLPNGAIKIRKKR